MALSGKITFCPQCGNRLASKECFGRSRQACPQCGWIYFPDPKVAAAVIVLQGEHLLLVRRANNPKKGLWTLPAGFVDAGEDPAGAAQRECLEETGLQVRVTGVFEIISGREHPHGADILIAYFASAIGGELQAHDDVDGAAFFNLRDLPPLAFEATQRIAARLKLNHLSS